MSLGALAVGGALAAAACGSDASGPETPERIDVEPPFVQLRDLADGVRLSATGRTPSGEAVAGLTFAWTSSNPAVVEVDGSGQVTPRANGRVEIEARTAGLVGAATVDVAACFGPLCDDGAIEDRGLHTFYRKLVDAGGIAVVGSHRVRDSALLHARAIVLGMLEGRDDVRGAMVGRSARVGIMASSEVTTDIPEHAHLADDPFTDWNERARGLGGFPGNPITTAGEENVLCFFLDRYRGESILVHELAHGIQFLGIEFVDPRFRSRLDAVYTQAMAEGLWAGTYAAANAAEYWAEGVQSWFDTNQRPQTGIHNSVDTRDELVDYDPPLASLIAEWFPETGWRPTCPA